MVRWAKLHLIWFRFFWCPGTGLLNIKEKEKRNVCWDTDLLDITIGQGVTGKSSSNVSVLVFKMLMILSGIEGEGVDQGPRIPHPQGDMAAWVNILPINPYNAISTFFKNLIFLTTPPPYFPESVTKNQILDPFFSTFRKNHFFYLKSPKKYNKSAKK